MTAPIYQTLRNGIALAGAPMTKQSGTPPLVKAALAVAGSDIIDTSEDDRLAGTENAECLDGGEGDDLIIGKVGNDTLFGRCG